MAWLGFSSSTFTLTCDAGHEGTVRFSQGWEFNPGTAMGTLVGLVGTKGDGSRPVKKRLRWVLVLADSELVEFPGSWVSPELSYFYGFVP